MGKSVTPKKNKRDLAKRRALKCLTFSKMTEKFFRESSLSIRQAGVILANFGPNYSNEQTCTLQHGEKHELKKKLSYKHCMILTEN